MSVLSFVVKGKKFVLERPKLIFDTLELQRGTEDFTVTNDNNRLFNRGVVALILVVGLFKFLNEVFVNLVKAQSTSCLQNTGRDSR